MILQNNFCILSKAIIITCQSIWISFICQNNFTSSYLKLNRSVDNQIFNSDLILRFSINLENIISPIFIAYRNMNLLNSLTQFQKGIGIAKKYSNLTYERFWLSNFPSVCLFCSTVVRSTPCLQKNGGHKKPIKFYVVGCYRYLISAVECEAWSLMICYQNKWRHCADWTPDTVELNDRWPNLG